VYAVLEPTLALAGLLGVTVFVVGQIVARCRPDFHLIPQRSTHAALFLGLAIWTVLFLLRHDVVTVVGLLLAMALLHRRNRALAGRETDEGHEPGSSSSHES
jgi:ABC-type phosphate transport system permease subunit